MAGGVHDLRREECSEQGRQHRVLRGFTEFMFRRKLTGFTCAYDIVRGEKVKRRGRERFQCSYHATQGDTSDLSASNAFVQENFA